jgi:hypothetical protein
MSDLGDLTVYAMTNQGPLPLGAIPSKALTATPRKRIGTKAARASSACR